MIQILIQILIQIILIIVASNFCYAEDDYDKNYHIPNDFIKNISEEIFTQSRIPVAYTQNLLQKAQIREEVLRIITSPKEKMIWGKYKNLFLTQIRIDGGTLFYINNSLLLDTLQKQYGVSPEIITAIIGVETNYGKYKPKFKTIDTLLTLAIYDERRKDFFYRELKSYVILTYLDKSFTAETNSSYAGAMGVPQFMPSSVLNYAVDYDEDCKIDLINNNIDILSSVANYFQKNGWKKDEPVAYKLESDNETLLSSLLSKNLSTAELRQLGINIVLDKEYSGKIIKLELQDNSEYWMTFDNFKAIKRYNPSDNYAMAVFQLSTKIFNNILDKSTYDN